MRDEHKLVKGIHHVTSCVGGAQEDIDFLTQVVGQRMIKQTVLFDGQVPIYHLYYANADAEIGTVMTTFPYRQDGRKGRKGTGQVAVTAYSVAEDSLDFWAQHLERHGVKNSGVKRLFGKDRIYFEDPVGLGYEVVGDNRDTRKGWTTNEISEANSVKGFNNVVMTVREIPSMEAYLVDALGFEKTGQEDNYHQYEINGGGPCKTVILREDADTPQGSWTFGEGTVHHVAFQVENDDTQKVLKDWLEGLGYTDSSEQKDRNYFHSVYCRSPGGILTEFATCDIGFTTDEPLEELGKNLMLPPWFEDRRAEIVAPLEPIKVPQ
ncbi:ring-cleaving dioxygenase [Pelagibacterium halotolerans]|uniref:Glyoxalase family protein n=1 Tax=Pelagibacterium halotolerans (strain DSM 22347 / JCM 15775 / CGMCC 1.7692 / B2) TaxID=1082931 RepID=G4R6F6_PELHB|nr:ring-cleaving dioxygenase [Pelagibacterium halotolerans]AEQ50161.1 glyoxalase family protein [Pelagibacterium halotolerans B2]QJR19831.1 ring-cleaving dioxygenase [Pelagibacterium halotolerans]SEA49398.1 glyoxalase family protein [Pelagibacterium halotolerans]